MTDISQVAASYTDRLNHCFMQTGDYSPPVSQCITVSPFHSPSHTSIPFCESYFHSNLPVLLHSILPFIFPFHSLPVILPFHSVSHISIPFCQSYFHSILPVILPFHFASHTSISGFSFKGPLERNAVSHRPHHSVGHWYVGHNYCMFITTQSRT